MIYLSLSLECTNEFKIITIMQALEPDNKGYVQSYITKNKVVFNSQSYTSGTMKNISDDLITCIKTAEDIIDFVLKK